MTADQRFSLLIAAMSLLFAIMCTLLGLLVKATAKWTALQVTVTELIQSKETDHKFIREEMNMMRIQMKEDRSATNERLTWLERHGGYEPKHGTA